MENQAEHKTLKQKIDIKIKDPLERIQILDDMNPRSHFGESITEFEKVFIFLKFKSKRIHFFY